ncbi:MAG: hypothetical protein A2091_12060 [Desulfuromonadales bacterium GWD2_61_12]|nr:MAG: hypothetical protein A2005_00140 [Desulfuromonadales bacterium GWC2_61_20]OGR36859.1 MAG: hypothetical protein A2091_12060 [Desulfuromonadales bacterium GWD2_61_12]HAD03762.1 hypothetical protein [Desulfuromonas sp.]HBT82274.1 hypothetical protein [Desulfuromonas sp.]
MEATPFPRAIVLRLFLRSLLLQASWNFERLQGLGALYVMAPALRYLYRDEDLVRAYGRHTEYFNTHPFLAPAVLGATLHLEAAAASGEAVEFPVSEFKTLLASPCAAMGDAFFWGGLRPLAAVVALFFALNGSLWAPLVLLILFNLPHLYCRLRGLQLGLKLGVGIAGELPRYDLPDWAVRLKQVTVLLLGVLCAFVTVTTLSGTDGPHLVYVLLLLPALAAVGWLCRLSVSPLLLMLGVATGVLFVFYLLS